MGVKMMKKCLFFLIIISFFLSSFILPSCSKNDSKSNLLIYKVGSKYGYINKEGKIVINPIYDFATNFSDGLAAVKVQGKWGYIDKNGKFVIEPKFATKIDDITFRYLLFSEIPEFIYLQSKFFDFIFSDGIAVVSTENKYGYINKKGKFIIEPQFDYATKFSDGLAAVIIGKELGYIDRNGKIIKAGYN